MSYDLKLLAAEINKTSDESEMVRLEDDRFYAEHVLYQKESRADFLKTTVPAFFFALKLELLEQIEILNEEVRRPADRIRLHFNNRSLQQLLITSNVARSELIKNENSFELTVDETSEEIVENFFWPESDPLRSQELCLYRGSDESLRIASQDLSFSIAEYALNLIVRFIEERTEMREAVITSDDVLVVERNEI